MEVVNRGEVVGKLTDWEPDMWYLEGKFVPAASPAGSRFTAAASVLNVHATFRDPKQGIRTLLRESVKDEGTMFVVMSLSAGNLFGRRIYEPAAVEWVIEHVPE